MQVIVKTMSLVYVSLNERKPEHLTPTSQLIDCKYRISSIAFPTQVDMAESDVEYGTGNKESYFLDKW